MQIQQEEGTPSWRRFTELLNLRFGPPLRSNPLGELVVCKRTSSVVDYQGHFEALLPRAASSLRPRRCKSSPPGCSRRSASMWRSTTRRPSPSL